MPELSSPRRGDSAVPLRAGDADREATAAVLRTHHAEGRLETDELLERIDRCFDSRTLDQLDRLVADLPVKRSGGPARSLLIPRRLWPAVPMVVVALAVLGAASGRHVIGLAFPIVFAVLLSRRRYARLR